MNCNEKKGRHRTSQKSGIFMINDSTKTSENTVVKHSEASEASVVSREKTNTKSSRIQQNKETDKDIQTRRDQWDIDAKTILQEIDKLDQVKLFDDSKLDDKLSQMKLHEKIRHIISLVIKDKSISYESQEPFINLRAKCLDLFDRWKELWPEEWNIMEMNDRYAVLLLDKVFIIQEKHNTAKGTTDYKLLTKQGFIDFHGNKFFIGINGDKNNKAKHWFISPDRREYEAIVFKPGLDSMALEKEHLYNVFRGYAVKPKKGKWTLFKAHIKDHICAGNEEVFKYVVKWMSSMFQNSIPRTKRTAILLMGAQGTGKNTFVDILGSILGQHYTPLTSLHELTSNFNSHLENAILIHANESLWGGNKQYIGSIKALITDTKIRIEHKGKDSYEVDNHIYIIFSSNEDWPVPLDNDDRRFLVLKVASKHQGNPGYFKDIYEEMDNGGREALLYDLQNLNLDDYDISNIPFTADKFDLKMLNQDSITHYIFEEILINNKLSLSDKDTSKLTTPFVYTNYNEWCKATGNQALPIAAFTKRLRKIIPSIPTPNGTKIGSGIDRACAYHFPSLQQCKKEFKEFFKIESQDIFGDGNK